MRQAARFFAFGSFWTLVLLPVGPLVANSPRNPAQTALVTLILAPHGELRVGAVTPKPIDWPADPASELVPWHELPRCEPHQARDILIVASSPNGPTWHTPIALAAPGGGRGGDVVDAWESGAVLARLPWLGAETRYVAVSLRPQTGGACLLFDYRSPR